MSLDTTKCPRETVIHQKTNALGFSNLGCLSQLIFQYFPANTGFYSHSLLSPNLVKPSHNFHLCVMFTSFHQEVGRDETKEGTPTRTPTNGLEGICQGGPVWNPGSQ